MTFWCSCNDDKKRLEELMSSITYCLFLTGSTV